MQNVLSRIYDANRYRGQIVPRPISTQYRLDLIRSKLQESNLKSEILPRYLCPRIKPYHLDITIRRYLNSNLVCMRGSTRRDLQRSSSCYRIARGVDRSDSRVNCGGASALALTLRRTTREEGNANAAYCGDR